MRVNEERAGGEDRVLWVEGHSCHGSELSTSYATECWKKLSQKGTWLPNISISSEDLKWDLSLMCEGSLEKQN